MIKKTSCFLIMIALMCAASVASAKRLEPFNLKFEVSRNGKALGEARLNLRSVGENKWEFVSETKGTRGLAGLSGVSIREHSLFRWNGERLQALKYQFDQEVAFKSKQRTLDIDPETKLISGTDDNGEFNLTYADDTLDRNLVVLALAIDLRANKKTLSYRVAGKRKIDIHRYVIAGSEKIMIGKAEVEALRIDRVRDEVGRSTTTWIAPSLHYLPIRIRQLEPDGETIEMRLR